MWWGAGGGGQEDKHNLTQKTQEIYHFINKPTNRKKKAKV